MLVLSKPQESNVTKIKLVRRASQKGVLYVLETYLPDGRITQKNSEKFPTDALGEVLGRFEQADLITENGDALYKKSRKGKEMLNISPKLKTALGGGEIKKADAAPLHKEKNRMLTGSEPFLYELGVSDKNGNVVEALRHKTLPIYGVQFHPERMGNFFSNRFYSTFFKPN